MTIGPGSAEFLRMFPTVVWTLQLDEEATRAINPAILRRLVEIRASAGEPSAGESWQSGHSLHRLDEFHDLVEAIQATTRKRSPRERVSISFNIMLSACAATLSPPLWGANS